MSEFWLSEKTMAEVAWQGPHECHPEYTMIRWIPADTLEACEAERNKLLAENTHLRATVEARDRHISVRDQGYEMLLAENAELKQLKEETQEFIVKCLDWNSSSVHFHRHELLVKLGVIKREKLESV